MTLNHPETIYIDADVELAPDVIIQPNTHLQGHCIVGEDTVLGWTARRLGVVSDFAPDAVVHHAVIHPGVAYHWLPRLGGRRNRGLDPSPNPSWQVAQFRNYADYTDSAEFADGLAELLALAPTVQPQN